MKRLAAIVLLVPLAILLVALAVANRHAVTLSLDPFNGDAPAAALIVPLYILVFASLALGVVVGGVGVWFGQGRWRRQARHLKRMASKDASASSRQPATMLAPALPSRELA